MPLLKGHKTNFNTLSQAFKNGHVGLVHCWDTQQKRECAMIFAAQYNDDESISMIPFARMVDENPFERYLPPAVSGGFILPDGSTFNPQVKS